ncbi:MAG TPA: SoxR reducing system RseC family protein [Desulfatiglandales bacterium]|nr:SoxR reducing system RseC family protein [Desulfatiglandales bacterium]
MDRDDREPVFRPKVYMHEEQGVVKEIQGSKALVLTDRQSMCGECVARGCCHMLGGGKEMLAEAINSVGAKAGDFVKIGIPEGTVAKASMVVYMVPALGLVSGATLGYCIARSFRFDSNPLTLVGSIVGLGVAFIAVRLLSNTLSKKPAFRPEIIKIITPDDLAGDKDRLQ